MFGQVKEGSVETSNLTANPQSPRKNSTTVDFDGYISVGAGEDGSNLLEIPVDDDGNLPIATLAHSFPEAIGLKFKNPSTGVYRTVDEQKRCIYAPKGGWGTRRYTAIFATSPGDRKRPSNDDMGDLVGEKRSGLDGSLNESLRVPVDLIVLNLSFKTDEEALKKFFEQYGEVQYVEVKRDFKTNMPKGYGFVKFSDIESQDKVLRDKEVFIDGRVAQVKLPNHFNSRIAQQMPFEIAPPQETISTKLYVGRVWNTLTEKDIFDVLDAEAKKLSPLAKFNMQRQNALLQVERVFIPKPHRGFAFVTVNDPNVTKRFCQIRDFIIRGKSVCVSIPTPKNCVKQTQQHMQGQDAYPIQYPMPQPPQGSMSSYAAPINYSAQYPQNQSWVNPRTSYRNSGGSMSYSHEYNSSQWK
uniref:RRM domain-containing protein n=1 Tax=Setaria digitata TaxID=48799 RepID=A0A915Q4Z6_9BILA